MAEREGPADVIESTPFSITCRSPVAGLPPTTWDENLHQAEVFIAASSKWYPESYRCPGRVKAWESYDERIPRQRATALHKAIQHGNTPRIYPFAGLECFYLGTVFGNLAESSSASSIDLVNLYAKHKGQEITHSIIAITAWFNNCLFTATRDDPNFRNLQRNLIDQLSQFPVVNVCCGTRRGGVSCICFVLNIHNNGNLYLLCSDATLALLKSLATNEHDNTAWGNYARYQITLKRRQYVYAKVGCTPGEGGTWREPGEMIPWQPVTWNSNSEEFEKLKGGLGFDLRHFGVFLPYLEACSSRGPPILIRPSVTVKQSFRYWASPSYGYITSACIHCASLTGGYRAVRGVSSSGASWCAHGLQHCGLESEYADRYLHKEIIDNLFTAAGNPARLSIFTEKKKFSGKKIYCGLVELGGTFEGTSFEGLTSLEEINLKFSNQAQLLNFKETTSLHASFGIPGNYLECYMSRGSRPPPSKVIWNFAFASCDCVHTFPRGWAETPNRNGLLKWKDIALGSTVRVYETFVPDSARLCRTLDDILAAHNEDLIPIVMAAGSGSYGVRFAVQKHGGYCYYVRECIHCAVARAKALKKSAGLIVLLATNNRRDEESRPNQGL